ncbi:hypothetical protein [Thermococcus sp. JCM 11816]|uniref:hypothetical protein n=1 Tax=Thermococcus sp. (strain JCM 11816 / KS-1) TaxID=1295125 RepID=UPI0006D02302
MSMKVHILSKQINENEYVAFDPMSKTVLILNRQEKNIIEKFQRSIPLSISEKYILKDILDFLNEKRENAPPNSNFH